MRRRKRAKSKRPTFQRRKFRRRGWASLMSGSLGPAKPQSHFQEVGVGATAIPAVGSLDYLTLIPQGTTAYNRIGNNVALQKLIFDYNISVGQVANDIGNIIRVFIGIDRSPQGAAATTWGSNASLSSVLNNTNQLNPCLMPRNESTMQRFVCLYDRCHQLGSIDKAAVITIGVPQIHHKVVIPLKGLRCTFNNATTGVLATIETNHIFVMFMQSVIAAANSANAEYNSRIRFIP